MQNSPQRAEDLVAAIHHLIDVVDPLPMDVIHTTLREMCTAGNRRHPVSGEIIEMSVAEAQLAITTLMTLTLIHMGLIRLSGTVREGGVVMVAND
jgi:hypothetical protein